MIARGNVRENLFKDKLIKMIEKAQPTLPLRSIERLNKEIDILEFRLKEAYARESSIDIPRYTKELSDKNQERNKLLKTTNELTEIGKQFKSQENAIWQKLFNTLNSPETKLSHENTKSGISQTQSIELAVTEAYKASCKLYSENYSKGAYSLTESVIYVGGMAGGVARVNLITKGIDAFISEGLQHNDNLPHNKLFKILDTVKDFAQKEAKQVIKEKARQALLAEKEKARESQIAKDEISRSFDGKKDQVIFELDDISDKRVSISSF